MDSPVSLLDAPRTARRWWGQHNRLDQTAHGFGHRLRFTETGNLGQTSATLPGASVEIPFRLDLDWHYTSVLMKHPGLVLATEI